MRVPRDVKSQFTSELLWSLKIGDRTEAIRLRDLQAPKPVDLVDDDVNPSLGDVGEQLLQGRTLEAATREAAGVVVIASQAPAF